MAPELESVLATTRVLVCLGPGGAGKTTTAAALAVAGAISGRRVAVLTVDPAARLKDALELPEEPGRLHPIALPEGARGRLDAIQLDAKGLFDRLVRRLSPSPALAERVLANPVYRNIAGAFAGSDAYMALEQLLDIVGDPAYELVIVDTPPATHALELFDAPERILALLNSRALEYLEEPARILGVGTSRLARGLLSAVLAGLERITGLPLLRHVSALAADFGLISPAFRTRAESIRALLRAADTSYAMVAAPDPHGADEILAFAGEVHRLGIDVSLVVVNRVLKLGQAARAQPGAPPPGEAREPLEWSATLARNLVACAHDVETLIAAERSVIDALKAGFAQLDGGASGRASSERPWLELPAIFPAPTSLAGIWKLAQALQADLARSTDAA